MRGGKPRKLEEGAGVKRLRGFGEIKSPFILKLNRRRITRREGAEKGVQVHEKEDLR